MFLGTFKGKSFTPGTFTRGREIEGLDNCYKVSEKLGSSFKKMQLTVIKNLLGGGRSLKLKSMEEYSKIVIKQNNNNKLN